MLQIHQRRYLGSKTKLLSYIDEIITKEDIQFNSLLDVFGGTGVVGSYFNDRADILINDLLYCNYLVYHAFLSNEELRENELFSRIERFNTLNPSEIEENYFSLNFADTYFSKDNCKIIGEIRDEIENDYVQGIITFREKAYLVTSLLYAMDRIANTVGHYDAYRKTDDLDRELVLNRLDVFNQYNANNQIYNSDANQLVKEVSADMVYIDPPYNSRQYSDAYHLLENVATWNKPEVFGVARKMDRSHIKSKYNLKTAAMAFSELIENLNTKYILVSYNDMGNNGCDRSQARISDHEILSALERKGEVTIYEKDFQQFTTGKSTKDDLKERIFFCRVRTTDEKSIKKTLPRKARAITKAKVKAKDKFVKSPLNYTGGKFRLLSQLTPYFPKNINTFYDVFCGGVNVGINADAKKIICIDKNEKLIDLFSFIQSINFEELHQRILKVIDTFGLSQSYINGYDFYKCSSEKGLGSFNKEKYISLRKKYNETTDKEEKNLLLFVLIVYAFNNQIRFNGKEQYNLPVGKRDYNGNIRKNLANFSLMTKKKDITFKYDDFKSILTYEFSKDDFVYLDPPYLLGTASYNENGGWTEENEIDLLKTLDKLNERGVRFALSNVTEHKNNTHHLLIDWAKKNNYQIIDLNYDYNNSNYQSKAKDGKTHEVLVVNYTIDLKE
ncbi:Dam family site-specific DNA-(adenine-N6)-methyltransferase [Fredinandcohnia humi]